MAHPPSSTAGTGGAEPPHNRARTLARLALLAGLLAIVAMLMATLAGFGSRWGLWSFRTGFSLLRWAAYGGIVVALLGFVTALLLVRARGARPRWGLPVAVAAFLVGLLLVGIPYQWMTRARSVPPIHDITTDVADPPQFVAVAPLRADAPNPIEYGGPEVAAQQRAAYPDIQPLLLDLPLPSAYPHALAAVEEMGWEIVAADSSAGRIEATDETFWFGFKDDVVIRLSPVGGRTVLDVRSLSRVGGGDAGTNARRIRSYLEEVRERIDVAAP